MAFSDDIWINRLNLSPCYFLPVTNRKGWLALVPKPLDSNSNSDIENGLRITRHTKAVMMARMIINGRSLRKNR